MKKVNAFKVVASTLVMGAALGGTMLGAQDAVASSRGNLAASAQSSAEDARAALAKGNARKAVPHAERAVAAMPQDANYRQLLGEAYLAAGRFASAETAFSDSLTLAPANGAVALKLALAKTAQGKYDQARGLLDQHRSSLPAADYGLAIALAGDPVGAVAVLETAAREENATARVRQNLALSYALSGRWAEARVVAGQDLMPDQVNNRIMEWASMARPSAPSDQIAALLKVTPAKDAGQPAALALAAPSGAPVAVAEAPAAVVASEAAPVAVAAAPSEPAPVFEVAAAAPVEVVETTPIPVAAPAAPVIRANPEPVKQVVVPASAPIATAARATPRVLPRPVDSGRFVVQLGAFSTVARADAAWRQATRRIAGIDRFDARQSRVTVKAGSLYRLAVSGFANRADAGRVCTQVRAAGGVCFIRSITANEPIRFAARRESGGQRIAVR
jgi:Flp pilus assembly protein TadD